MAVAKAYDEIADFIASASPARVAAFEASAETKARVWELTAREKAGGLTPEETAELDHYAQLEHLMRLAKARARRLLANDNR